MTIKLGTLKLRTNSQDKATAIRHQLVANLLPLMRQELSKVQKAGTLTDADIVLEMAALYCKSVYDNSMKKAQEQNEAEAENQLDTKIETV